MAPAVCATGEAFCPCCHDVIQLLVAPPRPTIFSTMAKCSAAAVAMATLLLFSGSLTRRASAFTFRGQSRRTPFLAHSSHLTSTTAATSNVSSDDDDRLRQQVPDDWKGASEKKSEFITHFVAGRQPNLTVEAAVESLIASSQSAATSANRRLRRDIIVQREKDVLIREADSSLRHNTSTFPIPPTGGDETLCAAELLALGSIWFLPSGAPRDAALGGKPIRLNASDVDKILEEGDYLRVHNPPRRFPAVNEYDWGANSGANGKGVVVAKDDDTGYMIVDKPAGLPVHGTVDNVLENVAAAVGRSLLESREAELRQKIADRDRLNSEGDEFFDMTNSSDRKRKRKRDKQKKDPLVYISNPQRLDQNTSGLFVLSTKKEFASYFAKLLRKKTDVQLADDTRTDCAVHKTYRCLVCVSTSTTASAADELARLRRYADEGPTVRHWLEPSIKAPKTFAAERRDSSWAECLLKIRQVGDAFPVVGNEAATKLSKALWEEEGSKPPGCVAVVEVEIELLTGRTHQIRGQMSAEGFPLVGDIGYGGALPTPPIPRDSITKSIKIPERLALQCCQLEFIEPKYHRDKKDDLVGVPSDTWKTFRLERAFWTPMLESYSTSTANEKASEATFSRSDEEDARELQNVALDMVFNADADCRDETAVHLPQRVKLSPGKNKYVVIEARSRSGETLRFVRSANPSECGGPYHADVARDVVRELTLLGYSCSVTGGGRIDYVEPHAHVYGFSYGFGKGDHELVAKIIEEHSEDETYATFDTSDGLY